MEHEEKAATPEIQPPVFVVFPNGDADAFDTVEGVNGFYCFATDITDDGGRVWDSTGLPLAVDEDKDHRAVLVASGLPRDAVELERELRKALTATGLEVPVDAPFIEVAGAALEFFEPSGDGLSCLIVLAPLAAIGALGVGLWILFGR